MFFSPLDQFEIKIVFLDQLSFFIYNWYLVFHFPIKYFSVFYTTNFNAYSLLCILTFALFLRNYNNNRNTVPNSIFSTLLEKFFTIIRDLIIQNFEEKPFATRYFSLIMTVFIFILFSNFIGLVPFGFTTTSFPIACFTISVSLFMGLTIFGYLFRGREWLQHFIPNDVPILIVPVIGVIEFISYFSKAFSLSIRLFANMMSGHILLNILSNFTLKLVKVSILIGLIPFIIVMGVLFLELGVCFLQAYVFMILLILYLNDSCKYFLEERHFDKDRSLLKIENNWWWCMDRGWLIGRDNYIVNNMIQYRNLKYFFERNVYFDFITDISEDCYIAFKMFSRGYEFLLDQRIWHSLDFYIDGDKYFELLELFFDLHPDTITYWYTHRCFCDDTYTTWWNAKMTYEKYFCGADVAPRMFNF